MTLISPASGGVGGVRTVISRQHELILRSVYPHADSELRSALCEQLVALLDIYLSGYVAQLTSLQQQQERYSSLEMEYSQRRSELLAPLRKSFPVHRFYGLCFFPTRFPLDICCLNLCCSGSGPVSVGSSPG